MLKIDDLVIDKEFEELLPVLTPEEFERLEQSILKMVCSILLKCGKNRIPGNTLLLMDTTDIRF